MLDELGDAAGVLEFGATRFAGLDIGGAFVRKRDFEALVEEGHFAQSLREGVVVEFSDSEDRLVGQEMHLGSAALAYACLAQIAGGCAATEVHLPGVPIAPDLDIELLRERVDATDADSMQTAGDLVSGSIEFAAGVKLGEHHFHRRH